MSIKFKTIQDCMNFVDSYSRLGSKITDLSRISELMNRIENPQDKLKFIHIAGTNGKGSTLEYIATALQNAGYKTGKFTSPFIVRYTDRIRINSDEIDVKSLCEICEIIADKVETKSYSQFEITMAIAFLWYLKKECDVVVLETGIGGKLDATNIIPPPLVSVITSVSLDHITILGDTLEKIAEQKAGIIKENSNVVLSLDNQSSTQEIIVNKAKAKKSNLIIPDNNKLQIVESNIYGNIFKYNDIEYKTSMLGIHQIYNAVTAIEVCNVLNNSGYNISLDNIKNSLNISNVKARIQYINENPAIIVDGGHNTDGIKALINFILKLDKKNIYAVIGMSDSKDIKTISNILAKNLDNIICVDGFSNDCISSDELLTHFPKNKIIANLNYIQGFDMAYNLAKENNGTVLICGSLYLASKYLEIR